MTIQFNAEQEQVIEQAIEAGLIDAPEDVVQVGIEAIRQQLDANFGRVSAITSEQWVREFHAWVHGHSAVAPLLPEEAISRESIYGTRGR